MADHMTHVTTRQAAQMVRMTREQLLRLIERGEIEAEYIRGRWYVVRASVESWRRQRAAK